MEFKAPQHNINSIEFLYKLVESDKVPDPKIFFFQNPPRFEHVVAKNGSQFTVARKIRYWKNLPEAKYPINLNAGFEEYKFHFDNTKMEDMELYYMIAGIRVQKPMSSVCTQQELLKSLMTLPFSSLRNVEDRDFKFYATHFRGILFMVKQPPFRGHKFENTYQLQFEKHFMCGKWLAPKPKDAIDESKKQVAIYSLLLGTIRVFYSSTLTGVYSECKLPVKNFFNNNFNTDFNLAVLFSSYLELNPCVQMGLQSDRYRDNWKDHVATMDWWATSFLTKTDTMQVGFVDNQGYVNEPPIPVDLKTLCINQVWKSRACYTFLQKILKIINDRMFTIDNPYTVYEFKYIGAKNQLEYTVHIGENQFSFLSPEFIDFMSH